MERSKEYGAEVEISGWASLARGGIDAAIRVWPLDNSTEKYPALAGRLTMTLRTGAATVQVNPTAAEARELIAALQWALDPAEQLTGEVAA